MTPLPEKHRAPVVEAIAPGDAIAPQTLCVVGLGYVGLPTALLFARHGFCVQGVDINPAVVQAIHTATIPRRYPELAAWWEAVAPTGRLSAASEPQPADVFLIAVPTPVHPHTKGCDLSAVIGAVKSILPVLQPGNLVILESTVPPGTTRNTVKPLIESTGLRVGVDVDLCFSPERILPGNTVTELVHNPRIIGGITPEAAERARAVFAPVIDGEIHLSDDLSAEFCKLAENTYRDVNIALANELSLIADEVGVDIHQAIALINRHPRVNVLTPGIGVGGHCIAVDPWFFVEVSPWRTELIATSRRVNDRMPQYCVQKIMQDVAHLENPRLCLVGLTYKPDVADTRESPALRIVEMLRDKGVDVVTYDPLLPEYADQRLYDAVAGADYLAVLVRHTSIMAELANNREAIASLMRLRGQVRVF